MTSQELITQWQHNKNNFKKNKGHKTLKYFEKDVNISAIIKEHDRIFSVLNCLDCANCCKSLPAKITTKDIEHLSKTLKMDILSFTKQYVIVDEDDDLILGTPPCPFLNNDNSCKVYSKRPDSCRTYPHTKHAKQAKQVNLHLTNAYYCPAVYHIINTLTNK